MSSNSIDKGYEPHDVEKKWYEFEWIGNPFEGYVRDELKIIIGELTADKTAKISVPFAGEKKLTNLWDTDYWTQSDPVVIADIEKTKELNIGLAEYSNANFVSHSTIFTDMEEFPYPNKYSIVDEIYLARIAMEKYEQMAQDGTLDTSIYIPKNTHGEKIDKFLAPRYVLFDETGGVDGPEYAENYYHLLFKLDGECYKAYAKKLIPRAIGYSASLIDYFFRGSIEITLPTKKHNAGTYAITTDPDQGFTHIALQARNTSPNGEEMAGGSIELVVKYKLALEDPFQSYPVPVSDEYSYSITPVANTIFEIPRTDFVELEFNLSESAIPINATDVSIYVVYRGVLGDEADSVVVGYEDISEPTPIEFISHLDMHCIGGAPYTAGSPEAIARIDANGNGVVDFDTEADVYPHNLENLYFRISSVSDPQSPSCTMEEDIHIPVLEAGEFSRVYILSDYEFTLSQCGADELIHVHHDDNATGGSLDPSIGTYTAIRNQTDLDIRSYPTFTNFKGVDIHKGSSFILSQGETWDWGYEESCSFDDLVDLQN